MVRLGRRLARDVVGRDLVHTPTERFTAAAVGHFGSGLAWLGRRADDSLAVTSTANADTPLRAGDTPLLTCDVWEHAYYIDYRNARARYVEAFWKLVDWQFVASQLAR